MVERVVDIDEVRSPILLPRTMYYIYVLRSLKNGRRYVGYTNNLERRLKEHNNGQSTYTKLTKPFVMIYHEQLSSRQEAIKREKFLKSGIGRRWLDNVCG